MNRFLPFAVCLCFVPACGDGDGDEDDDTETGDESGLAVEVAPPLEGAVLLGAWSDTDELYFVGGVLSTAPGDQPGGPASIVRIRDGEACREADVADRPLWWIHGPGGGEWYAVGENGLILHEVDGTRTDESVDTEAIFYGVWAQGGGDPVAVGGNPFGGSVGEVWRRTDGTWEAMAQDLPGVAFKVWEDWIVGDGVAWRIEGDELIEHFPPNGEKLLTVRGRGPDDVWAVGGLSGPVLLHWDGADWESISVDPHCASNGLNGVWTAPGEPVWIAGFFGGLGSFDGAEWACPDSPVTADHFHAVVNHDDEMWWAGGSLLSPGGDCGLIASTADTVPSEFPPCD